MFQMRTLNCLFFYAFALFLSSCLINSAISLIAIQYLSEITLDYTTLDSGSLRDTKYARKHMVHFFFFF